MSEQQNTVLNGPSGEVTMALKDPPAPQEVTNIPPNAQQPPVTTQVLQSNAGYHPRPPPPLVRIDSRSTVLTRPVIQQRTPLPPQQYIQRTPIGLSQRPSQPVTIIQSTRPLVQPGYRPATPFPRQSSRPQIIYQQRSVAPPIQRQPFNGEYVIRSQTLDQSDLYGPRNIENVQQVQEIVNVRPTLTSPLNRSYSLSSGNVEPQGNIGGDRRRSVSTVEGGGELKTSNSTEELNSRPESRASSHMNKITEDEDSGMDSLGMKKAEELSPEKKEELYKQSTIESNIKNDDQENKYLPKVPKVEPFSINKENETIKMENKVDASKFPVGPRSEEYEKIDRPKTPVAPRKEEYEKVERPKTPVAPKKEVNERIERPKTPVATKKEEHHSASIDSKSYDAHKHVEDLPPQPSRSRIYSDVKLPLKTKFSSRTEGDNDSGVDESTQGNDHSNGDQSSPRKPVGKLPVRTSSTTPTKSRSASRGAKSPNLKSPDSNSSDTPTTEKKKIPMNKVQVGSAPSPNLKVVKSKIGSLQNASYKPGGGNVKIENRKVEIKATPRIAAKNEAYVPGGGDKKIQQQKLQWQAKSKIGSLENAHHKPKGGEKKIESVKLDFKEKAKPKVGSKDNVKHVPGGGDVKFEDDESTSDDIENRKLDIKVQSKIGSLDNVKYKPGGGDKKIFDDKDYLRQKSAMSNENNSLSGSQNSLPSHQDVKEPVSDENLNRENQ